MISAHEDRQQLGLSIPEYRHIAEALAKFCYVNKQGQKVRIRTAKRKKLKNMAHTIRINKVKSQSPLYREMLHQIDIQVAKCEKRPIL